MTEETDYSARIPVRHRQMALDWSLVLASQEIAAVIEDDPAMGWGLLVSASDLTRATQAIELYRRENRRWPWQRTMLKERFVFDWASILWVVLTCIFFQWQNFSDRVNQAGVLSAAVLSQGEWWRCFTAEVLHADLLHLATNSIFGMLLLGLAMGRLGTGVGLLAAYLAGAAGNVLSLYVHRSGFHGLGASGVVMGALGLLAAQSPSLLRTDPRPWKTALGGLVAGIMLFALLGLNPGSDVAAHLGGFIAGVVLGSLLLMMRRWVQRPVANVMAGVLLGFLIAWPWLRAFRALGSPL